MILSKGEIWLANLNPSKKLNEIGKIRPVVVFQNNELNENDYPTTIVFPLSTSLIDDSEPIRLKIEKREKLKKDSDLIITQIRSIDNQRFIEKLAELTNEELEKVETFLYEILE